MHLVLAVPGGGELWVGSSYAAGDVEYLRKNGITALVACASNVPVARASHLKHLGTWDGTAISKGDIKWLQVLALLDTIGQALRNGARILLSCRNGAHRSALLIVLVICFLTGLHPDEVMRHVSAIREMCDFDSVHPGDRKNFNKPMVTPATFLRSRAEDLRACYDALQPHEQLKLNTVMTPAEFQTFAATRGVSFPDWGLAILF
jgi:hypothetical protein